MGIVLALATQNLFDGLQEERVQHGGQGFEKKCKLDWSCRLASLVYSI